MKKFIRILGIGILASAFFWSVPIYAQAETETAGSSLGKDNNTESTSLYKESERGISGQWINTNQGWTYKYSDGSSPKMSWRKIDGV